MEYPNQPHPMNPRDSMPTPPAPEKKMSTFVGAIIILVILVVAAAVWYYYSTSRIRYAPSPPPAADEATTKLQTQGTSDEVGAIEQDLDASIIDDLDRELEAIDAEL